MKRLFSSLILAACMLWGSSAFAQASQKGNFVLTPSLNIGGHGFFGGYTYYGSGFPFGVTLNADFSVHDYVSVGPWVAYNNRANKNISYHTIGVGGRGNFHFWQLIDDKVAKDLKADKLDWFVTLSLGGYFNRFKWKDEDPGFTASNKGGFAFGSSMGLRYYFNDRVGISFEYGYTELSWAKIGVPIKF
jgi:hypothetical protein